MGLSTASKRSNPKFRRPLHSGQIAVIELIYKYRFASGALLAHSLGIKHDPVLRERLSVLEAQKFIGRIYKSSYRLQGKPAVYYVLPRGLEVLRVQYEATNKGLGKSIDENIIKQS